MKIYKPDNLALLFRNFRLGREKRLALGMLAMFPYGASGIAALGSEQALWRAAAQVLGDDVLDAGLPKPAGEFFVYGAAYAPSGGQVQQIEVSAGIAGVRKPLYVFGDRQFGTLNASAPALFSRMPLTAAHAFGGEGYAVNPQGKGHADVKAADGRMVRPLPNVESPAQLMVSRGDKPEPAGYGALPADAPERVRHLGRLDQRWLQGVWPHLPEDTRAEYFHAAPPDQRIKGFFRGDEGFELVNLHPARARIAARLPALRARCFVHRRERDGEVFTELETRADSVWLFPDMECGVVLYRASAKVDDDDADDVLHVMAEWEELAAAPASFEHYRTLFLSRLPGAAAEADALLAQPFAAEAAPPVAAPAIAMPAAAAATAGGGGIVLSPQFQEVQAMVADIERQSREMMRQYGLTDADVQRQIAPQALADPPMSRAELEREVARLDAEAQQMRRQYGLSDADIARHSGGAQAADEGAAGLGEMKKIMLELEQQVDRLLADNGLSRAQAQQILAARPESAPLAAQMNDAGPGLGALFSQLEAGQAAAASAAALAVAVPAMPGAGARAEPPATPTVGMTREQVVARHAAGASLAQLDLSRLDLSGLDLSRADFSGALLEGARFGGSKLGGAAFGQALLTGADFSQADLQQAQLGQASAAGAIFAGARLEGADLSQADFTGGNFDGAALERTRLDGALFDQAAMQGVRAAHCQATQASFAGAALQQADFSDAGLERARFNGASLEQARFDRARCPQAEFYGAHAAGASFAGADLQASRADAGSSFDEASFARAQMSRVAWEGVSIRRADLELVTLDHADLSRAKAEGARLAQASAVGAKLDKAALRDADLSRINLLNGSMRAAAVEGASLQLANLYGVDFTETTPSKAALEGADIGRTVLALRGMAD